MVNPIKDVSVDLNDFITRVESGKYDENKSRASKKFTTIASKIRGLSPENKAEIKAKIVLLGEIAKEHGLDGLASATKEFTSNLFEISGKENATSNHQFQGFVADADLAKLQNATTDMKRISILRPILLELLKEGKAGMVVILANDFIRDDDQRDDLFEQVVSMHASYGFKNRADAYTIIEAIQDEDKKEEALEAVFPGSDEV